MKMHTVKQICTLQGRLRLAVLLGILFGLFALASNFAVASNDAKLVFLGNKNIAPVVYLDNGTPAGVVVDIVHALAKHIPQPVEIRAMDWAEAQALVARGDADALIQINETEERRKIYDFSDNLLESQFSIFVSEDRVGIWGISSLQGLRVGVEAGGLPQQVLEKNPQILLSVIPNFLEGFKLLNAGAIDAVVVDYRVGSYVVAENKLRNIRITGDPIAFSYSSIAVKKGNTKLLAAINQALQNIKVDGTYQKILDKWKPTEVVFQTREQITQKIYYVTTGILLVLFLIAILWTLTLRNQLKRRKAAEEKLTASLYARSLIEASLDPLVTISVEGKITDVNEATVKAIGVIRETLIGSDFSNYFTEPDKASAGYQKVFAEGFVTDYPLALRHASGSVMEVLYNASVYRNAKGEVAGVLAAARDVTKLKRAENALKERVKELRTFYHLSELAARKDFSLDTLCQELVNILPQSWRYPEITCARIVIRENEFRTANFRLSEWMQAAPVNALGAVIGKVEVGYLEQKPEEHEGPFLMEERQLIDAIAERVGQVTELKHAEGALRASEELFRSLANATSEGMLIHGHGRIVEANRQMEEILGRTRAEIVGAAVVDFVAPAWRDMVSRRVQTPEDTRVELAFVRPDGSEVFVSGLAHPCVYQGRPMRVAAYRDITLEKRAEEVLRNVGAYNRSLIEVSLDPLVTISPDGKITDVNDATIQATGLPRSLLIGSDFSVYFTEPDKARAGYQEVFAKGFVADYPLCLRHVSGRTRDVLYNASVYRNARGEVAGVFAAARDITELKKLERELERQAHIDLLTDLNNRRYFMELAEQELARSRRHGEPLSLLMMDLDNFKRVNDTYGHDIGDAALQKLSEVCRDTFRGIDIAGRLGGEEFAALLPETSADQAVEVAERLRQAVEGAAVKLEDGSLIHFTVSIGVAGFGAKDEKIETVLKRADAALYKAKNSGRNRVCNEGTG